MELIESTNRGFAVELGGDRSAWNGDRVMRLPYTVNYPSRSKRDCGWGPVMSRVALEDDGVCYQPHVLHSRYGNVAPPPSEKGRDRLNLSGDIPQLTPDDLNLSEFSQIRSAAENPPGGDQSGDGVAIARLMKNAGYSWRQAAGILLNPQNPVSAHFMRQRDVRRAVLRVIELVYSDDAIPSEDTKAAIDLIDPADWAAQITPSREWAVQGIVPWLQSTYLTGQGAVGKSLIAQQLATCISVGLPFLGLETRQSPAIYVTCEDDADELHRRQKAICEALQISLIELSGRLHLLSLAGEIANEMATFTPEGKMIVEKAYGQIEAKALEVGARFIVLDNIAHIFAGNENIRAQVAAFTSLMNRLAQKIGGSVLFLGHPNKAGQEYSGSTAWENQVRSRLYMGFVHDAEGGIPDINARIITNSKANYGPARSQLSFRWHDWAFVREDDLPKDQRAEIAAAIIVAGENAAFLDCLRERERQGEGRQVGPSPGPNYAPKQFEGMAQAKGFRKAALKRAMDRLFSIGRIETHTYRNTAKSRDVTAIREILEHPEPSPEPFPNTIPDQALRSPEAARAHTHI